MNATITLYPDYTDLVFTWSGGPYIEVWFSDPSNQDPTGDIINVYDYYLGKPSIAFTPKGMDVVCKRYVKNLIETLDKGE